MDVNDNACSLIKRVALESIASKLAPILKDGTKHAPHLPLCDMFVKQHEIAHLFRAYG